MIRTLILSFLVFPIALNAQEISAVKQTVQTMFEGMHTMDTSMVRSVFAKDALLQTIPEEQKTGIEIETGSLEDFIKGLSKIPETIKIEERLWSWDIKVDGHLATAWTEYTFFVNDEVSHCGVNAFQLFKEDSGWKITKIIDTRRKSNCPTNEEDRITSLLDNWHQAAAKADADIFFGSMAADGIYIGTDQSERWLRDELKEWAAPYFARESAWAFKPYERNIYLSGDGKTAWWEEKLETQMGICMGSGVMENTEEGWKIKHYHLGVTLDNDKLPEFLKLIGKE
jgi:hypothetical protein